MKMIKSITLPVVQCFESGSFLAIGAPQCGQISAWTLTFPPQSLQMRRFAEGSKADVGGVNSGVFGSVGGGGAGEVGAGWTIRVLSGKNLCWQVGHFTRSNCASSGVLIVCPQPGQSN